MCDSLHRIVGLKHSSRLVVDERMTVPALAFAFTGFGDMPPVFATAFMVGFVEYACIEALHPHLRPTQQTAGTKVDLTHVSATPIGLTVTAEVELVAAEGRKLRFRARCMDREGLIGEGVHERVVIESERFMKRVTRKGERLNV